MEGRWSGEQGQQRVKEERTSHIVATLHAGFHYGNQIVCQCLYPSCDKGSSNSQILGENQTLKNISSCRVGSDLRE